MEREIKRHLFHAAFGTVLALMYYYFTFFNDDTFLILTGASIALFFVYKKFKIPILHDLMLALERPKNLKTYPGIGAILFMIGVTAAVWIYPYEIALAAILILAWGDSMGALVGVHGKLKYFNPKKTWEGVIAGTIAGTLAAMFFVPTISAFSAAGAAMLLEGLNLRIGKWRIDDNLTIPIVAGLVMLII